jgi:N-methylhydantoinase A
MLNLDVVQDFARTLVAPIEELDPARVTGVYESLLDEAHAALDRHRIDPANRLLLPSVDLRYDGQEHTFDVPMHRVASERPDLIGLRRRFDELHEAVYGYSLTDPGETVVIRLRAVGVLSHSMPPRLPGGIGRPDDAVAGQRLGRHRESGGEVEWTVFDRPRLRAGDSFAGPALIEEATSTTLVGPTQHARIDELGNIRIVC